ncbi:receptor-like protein 12 [Coffea eugenioides]|uniref:receptor-like protein 12 n=1 Tax=Coffea eugenioides TaxID=49369 RepID=UPI000F605058|nr:receptor-like protein 12 [Coffea eugenioides]
MEKAYFLFLVAMVASLATASSSTTNVVALNNTSDHDLDALLAFKAAISDPQNILQINWSTSTSVCNWIGITCNRRHRRVAAIQLPKMGLVGTIPPQLGNLSFLVWLDLENNSFHGNLPTQMVHLRRLKHINLAFNSFDGEFPSWLGALSRLRYLSFRNNIISGSLPTTLSNATMLETIRLGTNLITGNLPQDWSALQNLEFLDMGNNQLEGPLPRSLFNLSSLQIFSFTNNTLSGYLPARICDHLPQLKGLYLSNNEFSGAVPAGIGGCPRLQILSLSYNNLAGNIPKEISNLTMLRVVFLAPNDVQGLIPADIGNLTNLEQLGIEVANLTEHFYTKKYLSSKSKMKGLGEGVTILGIKVKINSGGYCLYQYHYIDKILDKLQHLKVKEISTLFDPNLKLWEHSHNPIDQVEYSSAIGSLIYSMHCRKLDIPYAVSRLARYTKNLNMNHWKSTNRILGYLKRTKSLEVFYNKFSMVLEGYSNAEIPEHEIKVKECIYEPKIEEEDYVHDPNEEDEEVEFLPCLPTVESEVDPNSSTLALNGLA